MTQESWVAAQERNILLRGGAAAKQALNMLRITPTNRVVTEKGAKLGLALRVLGQSLMRQNGNQAAWQWIEDYTDQVESYQLTVGTPYNSRDAFLDVLRAELEKERQERMPIA